MVTQQQSIPANSTAAPSQQRQTNPRRTSPENSVTLRHHRLARDASLRASPGSAPPADSGNGDSPRRNSSGDSHETSASDPKKWFDQSNQNPTATFDSNAMDVDPPFFQRESGDSSNEDRSLLYKNRPNLLGHSAAHSSSADDYRSVIDDLTVEIHKLKEELKHYKQQGPDMLRKDKLFEIKVHGLPKRKKRELEATLRDFAAGLDGSPKSSSRNASRRANVQSGSGSKHASSSSGSNARPVDSAYASMSTGANSSGTSLGRHSARHAAKASEQKVENYLRDIPEGLYPRSMVMTDKERKKVVVRRLEQLFTGKIRGRTGQQTQVASPANPSSTVIAPVITETIPPSSAIDGQTQAPQKIISQPPNLTSEAAREAQILPTQRRSRQSGKKSRSRDNGSSNSNGDQTESAGNGNGNGSGSGNGSGNGNGNSSGSGTNTSPPERPASEQRPTRPKDLDPDRAQVPSENMAYIKHLGLVPPDLLPDAPNGTEDVAPDAEGWVYLNLLCNLAQLHMINVTPSFVRSAVSEISSKFQLSPDGRKIRWRGGTEGTRLSSDSSADNSENSPQTDGGTDNSNSAGKRKRQKTGRSTGDSGVSSKNNSKFGPQVSMSSDSFHYKPLFVRQGSPNGAASMDDTLSSFGPVEDSNVDDSRWGQSGSGQTSSRKKRRHDGAIIYYSGAPFCTDLSGDPGDASPAMYMMSTGQDATETSMQSGSRPPAPVRTSSGSSLSFRPLSSPPRLLVDSKMEIDSEEDIPGTMSDSGDELSEMDDAFPWSDGQQYLDVHPLEPCGLGGVLPDDHFMVVVTTKRAKDDSKTGPQNAQLSDVTEGIINRLASMSTSSPAPIPSERKSSLADATSAGVQIEYQSGRIKRLNPVPLPPPAIFFPPFSSDESGSEMDDIILAGDDDSDFDDTSSQELVSRQANPHHSDGYPDGHLSSGDEDGEDLDDEDDERQMLDLEDAESGLGTSPLEREPRQSIGSAVAAPGTARNRSRSMSISEGAVPPNGGSSAATAGKAGSDADSSSDSD